jgi:hypothetical protein
VWPAARSTILSHSIKVSGDFKGPDWLES